MAVLSSAQHTDSARPRRSNPLMWYCAPSRISRTTWSVSSAERLWAIHRLSDPSFLRTYIKRIDAGFLSDGVVSDLECSCSTDLQGREAENYETRERREMGTAQTQSLSVLGRAIACLSRQAPGLAGGVRFVCSVHSHGYLAVLGRLHDPIARESRKPGKKHREVAFNILRVLADWRFSVPQQQ